MNKHLVTLIMVYTILSNLDNNSQIYLTTMNAPKINQICLMHLQCLSE